MSWLGLGGGREKNSRVKKETLEEVQEEGGASLQQKVRKNSIYEQSLDENFFMLYVRAPFSPPCFKGKSYTCKQFL